MWLLPMRTCVPLAIDVVQPCLPVSVTPCNAHKASLSTKKTHCGPAPGCKFRLTVDEWVRRDAQRKFRITVLRLSSSIHIYSRAAMPSIGPSLLFATGLALGVGAGVLVPRKTEKAGPVPPVYTPPPPPSGEKREMGKLATPTGGVALAGGFPGKKCHRHR